MKENYEDLEMEVITFDEEDVITTSACDATGGDNGDGTSMYQILG